MTTNWRKIVSDGADYGTGPFVKENFPLWAACADQTIVKYWNNFHEMERCEPFWRLYTHWMEGGAKPEPPLTVELPKSINLRLTQKESVVSPFGNKLYGYNLTFDRIDGQWTIWNSMGNRVSVGGPPTDWETNWDIGKI